jgi:hypothetical protein
LIDRQSRPAEPRQIAGHLFRGIFGRAGFKEFPLSPGAQVQAVEDTLQESGPDGLKFWSGAAHPEPEAEVIIIHLSRDLGFHGEAKIPPAAGKDFLHLPAEGFQGPGYPLITVASLAV